MWLFFSFILSMLDKTNHSYAKDRGKDKVWVWFVTRGLVLGLPALVIVSILIWREVFVFFGGDPTEDIDTAVAIFTVLIILSFFVGIFLSVKLSKGRKPKSDPLQKEISCLVCPNCEVYNTSEMNFCHGCGFLLPKTILCPKCSGENSSRNYACRNCDAILRTRDEEVL
ncbi:MAG: hypothetical protein FWG82_03055 [Oscillospiraceae bacterium]|nr:hypothetical protein [Oscillospiraceae bacterium]